MYNTDFRPALTFAARSLREKRENLPSNLEILDLSRHNLLCRIFVHSQLNAHFAQEVSPSSHLGSHDTPSPLGGYGAHTIREPVWCC